MSQDVLLPMHVLQNIPHFLKAVSFMNFFVLTYSSLSGFEVNYLVELSQSVSSSVKLNLPKTPAVKVYANE